MLKKMTATLLPIICIILAVLLGAQPLIPPPPNPIDAPATEFSAERAREKLKQIAAKPHPIGSEQHSVVHDYIVSELNQLNIPVETQETTSSRLADWGVHQIGQIRNIMGRLEGTGDGPAILVAAHYDTDPFSPGANDDGIAVSAMLETIRALKAGPALQQDVIFLFTDGEEVGLLGAQAFIQEHRWSKEIGMVFNFEARGSSGPSILFETGEGNHGIMNEFAQAVPDPVAYSFLSDMYSRLSNDTDLTVFKRNGVTGLNFAFVDGYFAYHTPLDNIEHVDMSTFQHHGSTMLSLLQSFGNKERTVAAERDNNATYFNVLNTLVITYSLSWTIPLTVLAFLLVGWVFWLGLQKGALTVKKVLFGFFLNGSSMVMVYLLITGVWKLLQLFYESPDALLNDPDFSYPYVLGLLFLTGSVFYGLFLWQQKLAGFQNLAMGMYVWWLLLVLSTNIFLPGAHYLFVWPLFCGLISLLVTYRRAESTEQSRAYLGALSLLTIPAVLLFTPFFYFMHLFVTLQMSGVLMAVLILLLGLLIPQWTLINLQNKWMLSAAGLVIGIGLCIAQLVVTAGSGQTYQTVHDMMYSQYTNENRAVFASTDAQPSNWTKQFLSEAITEGTLTDLNPTYSAPVIKSEAPFLNVQGPEVKVQSDQSIDGGRSLELLVTSPRGADELSFFITSDAKVKAAWINGKPIKESADVTAAKDGFSWGMEYYGGVPDEGIRVRLQLSSSEKVQVKAVDLSYELPDSLRSKTTNDPKAIPVTFTIVNQEFAF
ncbi:M28 family peptidase [Brevibacillus dissolubilis]|uniref:M28 family peptidase n=1 Tax=Brevibacillus dissolubilis TaxID=1844116 RepID=UPI00159BC3D2|nr:M28 family peptidase [Brevibacillus dissolubilis]